MTVRLVCWLFLAALVQVGCGREEEAPRVRQVPGGHPERAPAAFAQYGCGGCHVIPGIQQAQGRAAPPLTDFADRAWVAGVISNHPENLVQWIQDPTEIHDHTAMPDLGVTEQDARDMAAYLYTLRRGSR